MQILALGVGTLTQFCVEPAFGHLLEIVLVQELAQLALFAQPAQPMLANDRLSSRRVLVRAL